ncbi:hypothetical protein Mkiyose1665_49960 [Mycobacterium kiyosense]|nr:hypothetical protein MKCMC460_61970 [Mycobacterium sp. 20KCMC460]GLB92993.1 hypothetical protein SRL2020130_58100 [Mycobacterium kiyosense]GLC04133.1 hypothetical protein SRL2020400_47240 [Mycobacterium kiyosense]GLC11203.1 hypothetical protein SRL2020411_58490 [Mycobacterium kiyosense]GLC17189.1 hypothetical protein SRL2020448_57920 [Mycobacterium kiyosense]
MTYALPKRFSSRRMSRQSLGNDASDESFRYGQEVRGSRRLSPQGYFVYDAKKSVSQTVSHLRFGPHPMRAPYLVTHAVVGCQQFLFLDKLDVLGPAAEGEPCC